MSNKTRWLAIGGAAVVGVALMSAQQTGALWSKSVAVGDGATIHSGILDLSVGQGGTTDYPFTALAGANLMPGGYAQAPVPIHNSGNVLMKYRLQNAAQSSTAMPMTLTVSAVASEASCPAQGDPAGATQLYNGPMIGAQAPTAPQWRSVEPGAGEVLCMRATIGADAPHSASTSVTFTFAAESR
ncbi:hypothetical protein [Rhodococcus maanshanensis]|uniref:SipW-cognate class signal peptide n=1 Tax=Rhodococcus maanshanensis TaxID=183556 RepID=A0A1H7TBA8_9NOCA|nr:hypothetical protein [Rhodococcus maanshanensis]SEL82013.1 hypothetical protein SAMN05444583_11567 [Rhodococcus maanshanensis]